LISPVKRRRSNGSAPRKPDAVILAAAKVGGIAFNNSYPVDFLSVGGLFHFRTSSLLILRR
jgi:hypothetical protein